MMHQPGDEIFSICDNHRSQLIEDLVAINSDPQLSWGVQDANLNSLPNPLLPDFLESFDPDWLMDPWPGSPLPLLFDSPDDFNFEIAESPFVDLGLDNLTEPARDTTTPTIISDAQGDNDDTPTDPSLDSDHNKNIDLTPTAFEEYQNDSNSESVDEDSHEQTIFVTVQLPEYARRRFRSEKKRRTKKLKAKPMTIDISYIQQYDRSTNQKIYMRLTLTTASSELSAPVYIHADELKNYAQNVLNLTDGSICIQVTEADIARGYIELPDLAIIKTKLKDYSLQLIQYSSEGILNTSESYPINNSEKNAANAKLFRKRFNLKACQIQCQVLVEEGGSWDFTHIKGATHVMIEKEHKSSSKKKDKTMQSSKTTGAKLSNRKASKSTKRQKPIAK